MLNDCGCMLNDCDDCIMIVTAQWLRLHDCDCSMIAHDCSMINDCDCIMIAHDCDCAAWLWLLMYRDCDCSMLNDCSMIVIVLHDCLLNDQWLYHDCLLNDCSMTVIFHDCIIMIVMIACSRLCISRLYISYNACTYHDCIMIAYSMIAVACSMSVCSMVVTIRFMCSVIVTNDCDK